jgi:yecA family protein
MKPFPQDEPLTDAELDRLEAFLQSCKGGRAMNVEQLDGFFAALIAGPETVMPSEYYSEVFGGEMSEACEFGSLGEANEILGLMMRHWNTIAATLYMGEPYVPLLLEGEDGVAHGNDWARGFMRGMHMRHDGWAELMDDEEHGGCLVPMMMLFHEHDEDPENQVLKPSPRLWRSKDACKCWGWNFRLRPVLRTRSGLPRHQIWSQFWSQNGLVAGVSVLPALLVKFDGP